MQRRQFLASLAAAPILGAKSAPRLTMNRISFITDEAAASPDDAIVFAHKYGLKWVELRSVPGGKGHYGKISEDEAKKAAAALFDAGLRVSFMNTPFFKITLPGSEPVFKNPETPERRERRIANDKAEFENRKEDFETAFRNCHIFHVDKMRVFSFRRVAQPESKFQHIADVLGEVTEWASKEGIHILLENENSCNVVTGQETGEFMKLMPQKNFGFNWDPHNELALGAVPYPDGYAKLPKDRIENVQAKGKSLLEASDHLDWASIFKSLASDGFTGCVGLETHYFDGTKIEKSHKSMEEIRRILVNS